jgi:hypothetical protein
MIPRLIAPQPLRTVRRLLLVVSVLVAGLAAGRASTLVSGEALPLTAIVGSSLQFGFTSVGTAAPAYFEFTGSLPPGLSFSPAPVGNRINASHPVIRGTPTGPGVFTAYVTAFSTAGTSSGVSHPITISVLAGVAPVIVVAPAARATDPGVAVSFSAQVNGVPFPKVRWQRMPAGGFAFSDVIEGPAYTGVESTLLTVNNPALAMHGDTFRLVATNPGGVVTSAAAALTVRQAPVFTSAASASFALGLPNAFAVVATGSPRPVYSVQGGDFPAWASLDPVTGVISGTPPADAAAAYTFTVRAENDSPATQSFTLNVPPWRNGLINFGAYARVSSTGVSLRFTIEGGRRSILLRAVGPSLPGIVGYPFLPDPVLSLSEAGSGRLMASNDDWAASLAPIMESVQAFPLGSNSKDAAVSLVLEPGTYVADVSGANGSIGWFLVELYDLQRPDEFSSISSVGVTSSTGDVINAGMYLSTPLNLRVNRGSARDATGSYGIGRHELGWNRSPIEVFHERGDNRTLPPVLGTNPVNVSVQSGYATAFSAAVVSGSPPLSYQWRKAGVPIPGATGATLPFLPATTGDAGAFDLLVTNAAGSATSAAYNLSVLPVTAPAITSQPASFLAAVGNPARFFVSATGTLLEFQWRKNGVPIPGANGANLQFTTASFADAGAFDVVVSNSAGSVVSVPATLSFGQLPPGLAPPSLQVRLGEPAVFSVSPPASGAGPTYLWTRGGVEFARNTALFAADGTAQGTLSPGQLIPANRWTTPNGGAMFAAGIGTSETGQVAGATNQPALGLGVVGAPDLGSYSVAVTVDGVRQERGTGLLTLRGYGRLGRRLFAVGGAGTLLTSPDGIAWQTLSSGTATELRGVAVRGDLAVAVGASGTVVRSIDGDIWSAAPQASTVALNAVAAGPDRFVAVGDGGRVVVSANGTDWYLADSRTNTNLTGVTYGNGTYVMSGSNGAIFVSPDGFRWANVSSTTTASIQGLTYSGRQFWALAGGTQLLTSPTGFTWTQAPAPTQAFLRSLTFTGELLVAVGTGGRVQTSPDGVTWTQRSTATTQALLAATWSGADLPEAIAPATIVTNVDFRIIEPPRETSVVAGQPALLSISVSGGQLTYQWSKNGVAIPGATARTLPFAQVGAADVATYRVAITSSLGQLTSASVRLGLIGAGSLGSQFLAVGADGTVLTSPDGLSFTERALSEGILLRAVAASAFRAVAVGRGNQLALSTDGINWTYRTLTLPGTPRILRGVAAGPTQFVAVGSAGTILLSLDQGETWQLLDPPAAQSLWGVAWNGSRFVAVGDNGLILASPDGLSWSTVTSPTTERLYAVAAHGAKFAAVSVLGSVFESPDGISGWSAGGSSAAAWVRGATLASDGRRVVVGDRGLIGSSRTGDGWTVASSPTSVRLYGVCWTGITGALATPAGPAANGPALRIITPPAATAVPAGGTASFSVVAGGLTPLSYQWHRDGIDIPGGTTATLILPGLQAAQAGAYGVTVANPTGAVASPSAALTVLAPEVGIAPAITAGPAGRTATVGSATSFVVTATGSAPLAYRWRFNGETIPGAVSATLSLSGLQLANGGSYSVEVSNAFGWVTSAPALLTVTNGTGAPVISAQPQGQSAAQGATVILAVTASGGPPLAYQWYRDGVALTGQNASTLTLVSVTPAQSGVYAVAVSNPAGTTWSSEAGLTVLPPGTAALHAQSGVQGYLAGETVSIQNSLSFVGEAQSLGWEVLLPAGWSFVSAAGSQGDVRPGVGETQILSWAWTAPPASPVAFSYVLRAPAGATGNQTFSALAIVRQGGVPIRLLANPDPLVLVPAASLHSADTDGNYRLSLLELTRVIELYNTRNGTTRTGAYDVAAAATEDGFEPAPARLASAVVTLTRYHSGDSNRDGKLALLELTRVIELYNYRVGGVRTGQYKVKFGTEDGFDPGP